MAMGWMGLALLNGLLAGVLALWAWRLSRRITALNQAAVALQPAAEKLPRTLAAELDAQGLIGIRILNPMELAASKSRFAATFGSMAGPLIRRKVLEQVAESLRQGLSEQQVQAQVRIYRD